MNIQYKHIAIEGNIGSGKTTLASMLARDFKLRLILEEFEKNPFLPQFYESPENNAFALELFFMAERYHQFKNLSRQDIFQPQIISDYFFVKSKLFAQNNLQFDEMQLFNRLFDIMFTSLSKPDLLVYLHSDIKRLQKNIKQRGRDFEQDISEISLIKSSFIAATNIPITEPYSFVIAPPLFPGWLGAVCEKFVKFFPYPVNELTLPDVIIKLLSSEFKGKPETYTFSPS